MAETAQVQPIPYTLYYRNGNNPHPQQKNFYLPTKDMKTVIERSKKHCETMGIRFVQVRPLWTNLDEEEKAMMRNDG